jgi:integrase
MVPVVRKLADRRPTDVPLFKIPDKKCVNRNLRYDAKQAGVCTNNLSFHSLRHTFCTSLARANVHPALLQKLARHADLKTTLKFYVHLQRDDEADAIDVL